MPSVAPSGKALGKKEIRADFAFGNRAEHQSVRQHHGHVLHAVHGDVRRSGKQGLLDFLHEQALAAHFGQRHVENDVAAGPEHEKLDFQSDVLRREAFAYVFGLPQGELTAARGNDDFFHRDSR